MNIQEIDTLLQDALAEGSCSHASSERARKILGTDELNWTYFLALYRAKKLGAKRRTLWIHEQGNKPQGAVTAYPTAIAPKELLGNLRVVKYRDPGLSAEAYESAARGAALWLKKMQAGSGSSLTRTSYLSRIREVPESQIKIGAKGTDLFMDVPASLRKSQGVPRISIAEAQVLQALLALERQEFSEVIFHDIVSSETQESIGALWEKPSLLDPSLSYCELVSKTRGASHFGSTMQAFLPTLDDSGKVSFNRRAPGGHALFAVDALRAAYHPELRPKTRGPLVAAISNGEDLNGTPDSWMLGYMLKERIPIALVTTDRTAIDLKGGIVSLVLEDDGSTYVTILETAQANEVGQGELFSRLPGLINTNLALFNYELLVPLLTEEVSRIGERRFLEIITPDLITNPKTQIDTDGISRKYVQLEGAMGSTIMNLDRYWRRTHGEPLVQVINVAADFRTDFFCPIKSAFDYFMQFHADRFEVSSETLRLKNLRPGALPEITLRDPSTGDKFYQDVQNVLDAFQGARIRDLDELVVEGKIRARGAELRGRVRIINKETGVLEFRP